MLSMIAAASDNNAIGRDNTIPWHVSADLKRFKDLTSGHPILMGRKTFESLGRVLPKRQHYVLTSHPEQITDHPRVHAFSSLEEILQTAEASEEEWFIIGGASLYEETMDRVSRLYLTRVHTVIPDADAFFPVLDDHWDADYTSGPLQEEDMSFEFINYVRKI